MRSHLCKGTTAAVAAVLLASACSSDTALSPRQSDDGVTQISSAGTTTAVRDTESPTKGPDLTDGFEVFTLEDRSLWAAPVPYAEGCDGLPAYRLWSIPDDSTDATWVASTLSFTSPPIVHESPSGGVVTIDECGGRYTVHFADVSATGEFSNERKITPGDVKAAVATVYYDDKSGAVVFQLDDSATEPTLVWVYPASGEVDRSVPLGQPATGCSAAGMSPRVEGDDQLPPEVATKRVAIIDAAIACDFAALEALTGPDFVFQLDSLDPGPAYAWAVREQVFGDPVLETLVLLLRQPATVGDNGEGGIWYGWPQAYVLPPDTFTPATRRELITIGLAAEHADRIMTGEADYVWYRTGMDPAGTWRFFLAGD